MTTKNEDDKKWVDHHESKLTAVFLWNATLERMKAEVTPAVFTTWFQDTAALSLQDAVLTVRVPSMFAKSYIESSFLASICTIASEIAGTTIDVRVEVAGQTEHSLADKAQYEVLIDRSLEYWVHKAKNTAYQGTPRELLAVLAVLAQEATDKLKGWSPDIHGVIEWLSKSEHVITELREILERQRDETTIYADAERFQKIMDWLDSSATPEEIQGMQRLLSAKAPWQDSDTHTDEEVAAILTKSDEEGDEEQG